MKPTRFSNNLISLSDLYDYGARFHQSPLMGLSQKQPNGIIPYLIRNLCNVKIRLLWIPAFAGMIWNLTFETARQIAPESD